MTIGTGNAPASEDAPAESGSQDLPSGLFLLVAGVAALYLGRGYDLGSSVEMGPGYVPRLLALGLMAIGAILAARGLRARQFGAAGWDLRSVLPVAASILVFGLAIEGLGLVVAGIAAVVLAMLGERRPAWRQMPLIAVGLAGFCALLFGWALELSLPVWPR